MATEIHSLLLFSSEMSRIRDRLNYEYGTDDSDPSIARKSRG
jgi:hypothetical protein